MKRDLFALRAKGELGGLLAAAVVLCAPATAAAADPGPGTAAGEERQGQAAAGRDASRARSHADLRDGGSTWATYRPSGWSAGTVRRGTGYWRTQGSLRVRDVQRRLRELGYELGSVDGLFGPRTEAAVRQFQRRHALEVSGAVGAATLEHLRKRSARGDEAASRPGEASGSETTRSEQQPKPTVASVTRPSPDSSEPSFGGRRALELLALELLALALILALVAVVAVAIARRRRHELEPRTVGSSVVASPEAPPRNGEVKRDLRYGPPTETLIPIAYSLTAEGVSRDEAVGSFAGSVYAVALPDGLRDTRDATVSVHAMALAGEPNLPEHLATQTWCLVVDQTKPHPVWVRMSELQTLHADPAARARIESAGPEESPAEGFPLHHRRQRPGAGRPGSRSMERTHDAD